MIDIPWEMFLAATGGGIASTIMYHALYWLSTASDAEYKKLKRADFDMMEDCASCLSCPDCKLCGYECCGDCYYSVAPICECLGHICEF